MTKQYLIEQRATNNTMVILYRFNDSDSTELNNFQAALDLLGNEAMIVRTMHPTNNTKWTETLLISTSSPKLDIAIKIINILENDQILN